MDSFYITTNQGFFFGAAPSFDFVFPLKGFRIGFHNLTPYELNKSAFESICIWVFTGLMLAYTSFQILC